MKIRLKLIKKLVIPKSVSRLNFAPLLHSNSVVFYYFSIVLWLQLRII